MSLASTGRTLTAVVLVLVLLAFTLAGPRLRRHQRDARGRPGPVADARADAWSPACHAAMALGMAVMLVLLL